MGPSVDIWALGILLYFMVTGVMPFKGSSVAALKNAILDGKFIIPEFLSMDCMDIITGILRRKPEWRLTMAQVCNRQIKHNFFYPNMVSPLSSSATSFVIVLIPV